MAETAFSLRAQPVWQRYFCYVVFGLLIIGIFYSALYFAYKLDPKSMDALRIGSALFAGDIVFYISLGILSLFLGSVYLCLNDYLTRGTREVLVIS